MPDDDPSKVSSALEPVSFRKRCWRFVIVLWLVVVSSDLTFGMHIRFQEYLIPKAYLRLPAMTQEMKYNFEQQSPAERIAGRTILDQPNPQTIVVELPELDPWGTAFRAVLTVPDHQIVRLYSSGPDRVSKSAGLDVDDITDDIARREFDRYARLIGNGVSIGMAAWTMFLIWAIVIRKRKENWLI